MKPPPPNPATGAPFTPALLRNRAALSFVDIPVAELLAYLADLMEDHARLRDALISIDNILDATRGDPVARDIIHDTLKETP